MDTEQINYVIEDGTYIAQSVNLPALIIQAENIEDLKTQITKMFQVYIEYFQSIIKQAEPFNFVEVSGENPIGEDYIPIRLRDEL